MNTRRQTLWMAAAALAACGLVASCKIELPDDSAGAPDQSAVVPSTEGGVDYDAIPNKKNLTVDAWAHELSYKVPGTGRWEAVGDRRFVLCTPSSGEGGQTVTLHVQNNQSGERKEGHLAFLFADDATQNMALFVEQKTVGDYSSGENAASKIATSNRVYAVGYSYNAMGEYASPNSVMVEVFDTRRLINEGILALGPTQVKMSMNTVTGSTISEVAGKLGVSAGVKGGFGPFKAEMQASFDMSNAESSNYEYATTYLDLQVRKAYFGKNFEAMKDYVTDDVWTAINGIETTRRGVRTVEYPMTEEGFYRLVRDFGTHVVIKAGLGGRVRYSMEADASNISTAYDIKAMMQASYNAGFASANVGLDLAFSNTYDNNEERFNINLDVLGGDELLAKQIAQIRGKGFTEDNVNAWVNSVSDANMALVSFDSDALVPLYELVDRNVPGGALRYRNLIHFYNGEPLEEAEVQYQHVRIADLSSYECGTVTAIPTPRFTEADRAAGGTLVKDILLGNGQLVGQVCEEYVPNIDLRNRVTVVYPVINNRVRYNMGFFIGDAYHRPARVSWFGNNNVAVVEYPELDFGAADTLYLRGSSVSAAQPDGTGLLLGYVENAYLKGIRAQKNPTYTCEVVEYPLVKLFDNLWTRTEYVGGVVGQYYSGQKARARFAALYTEEDLDFHEEKLEGWHLPTMDDYSLVLDKLANNGHSLPLLALEPGGVTGFDYLDYDWHMGLTPYLAQDKGCALFDAWTKLLKVRYMHESGLQVDKGFVRLVREKQDELGKKEGAGGE